MTTLANSPEVRAVPHWRHRIRLPDGSVTPGTQDNEAQLRVMDLPSDLTGKTVLDIGCSDGFFAFECERRGAARVVGFDNYSSPYIGAPHGFSVVKSLLGSRVELVIGDLTTDALPAMGSFDLVLFLGVLYHLKDPFGGLERVSSVCRNHVIVETAITRPFTGLKWNIVRRLFPGVVPSMYMQFSGPEINIDPSTWWQQSTDCVEAMMRTCGFCAVRTAYSGWDRGIFHGFGPGSGTDAAELAARYDAAILRRALEKVVGLESRELKTLTIREFAAVKQMAAELKAAEHYGRHD
jgi:tRNA (mo5U34)-methyltransferase